MKAINMRLFTISSAILIYISEITFRVDSHICVLRKRSDPRKGGMLRWSLSYDQLCRCQGVLTNVHVLDMYCPELDMTIPGKLFEDNDDSETALWYIDDPTQLTFRKNWNKETLDKMLNRTEYCAVLYWVYNDDWGACSTTCDGGIQTRTQLCIKADGKCAGDALNEERPCNEDPCPTWKYIHGWSACSATCYGGTQTRTQSCVNSDNTTADGQCSGKAISKMKACNDIPCPTWKYVNGWSACSATCYGGTQTHTQSCVNSDNTTTDGQCSGNAISEMKPCNEIPCLYGECYTDGHGVDYRGVVGMTKSGKTCQKWTSQSPHTHSNNRPELGLGDHNYCRNPPFSTESGIWCYTTDVNTRWELCDTDGPNSICDAMPQDCYDMLHMYDRNISGVYTIYPINSPAIPVKVWCDMETDGGGWTVFQRRQNGSVDFYRDWAQYASGFGDVEGEFWLGNENIHTITNITGKTYDLRIDLNDGIESKVAVYSGFYITDSEDKYRLKYDGYVDVSTAGDGLTKMSLERQFSTHEQDNDISFENCAQQCKGGWWYGHCHEANLNGLYMYGDEDQPTEVSVLWVPWKGYGFSLKKSEMKMRPVEISLVN